MRDHPGTYGDIASVFENEKKSKWWLYWLDTNVTVRIIFVLK